MDTSMMKLKKELYRRLPSETEYRASRRIEGWMDPREETTAHKYVTLIVDDEISQTEYDRIIDKVRMLLKKDEYFKRSQYRVYLWKQDSLTNVTPGSLSYTRAQRSELGVIQVSGSAGSDWSKFPEIYAPHRKSGQVILFTTKEKIEKLRTEKRFPFKNLLIVYPADPDAKIVETVAGITCVAC